MLEVAAMGLHVAQMTSLEGMRACFDAVTTNGARILGLDGYGIAPGCNADLVLLQAGDPIEAIRLRATRLIVIRQGKILAQMPPQVAQLHLPDGPTSVDFRWIPPSTPLN
jgi:cytosine deaminase